jgi:hypothetical protein
VFYIVALVDQNRLVTIQRQSLDLERRGSAVLVIGVGLKRPDEGQVLVVQNERHRQLSIVTIQ